MIRWINLSLAAIAIALSGFAVARPTPADLSERIETLEKALKDSLRPDVPAGCPCGPGCECDPCECNPAAKIRNSSYSLYQCDQHIGSATIVCLKHKGKKKFYAISAAHVTRGKIVQGLYHHISGRKLNAVLVLEDEELDLALLYVGDVLNVEHAELALLDGKVDEAILVCGSPLGCHQTLSRGLIVNLDAQEYLENCRPREVIDQLDVTICFGNSGGGVFNKRGELFGVVVSVMRAQTRISFMVPLRAIEKFLEAQ